MINSIFDPGGNQTEHSGSTFMGPRADNGSQMPSDVVDGFVDLDEAAALDKVRPANSPSDKMGRESVKELNPDYADDRIWTDRSGE